MKGDKFLMEIKFVNKDERGWGTYDVIIEEMGVVLKILIDIKLNVYRRHKIQNI